MSVEFEAIAPKEFRGSFNGQPFNLCQPRSQAPRVITAVIKWADYGADSIPPPSQIGIAFNLNRGVTNQLDAIRGVYIDNTASIFEIYVRFPDTQFVVSVGPNQAAFIPVFTASFQPIVYARNVRQNFDPVTTIIFTNILTNPFTNTPENDVVPLYLGTDINAPAGQTSVAMRPKALGDQRYQGVLNLTGAGNTLLNIAGTPKTIGANFMTAIDMWVYNLQATTTREMTLILESTGTFGRLLEFHFMASPTYNPGVSVYRCDAMQYYFPAREQVQLRNVVAADVSGVAQLSFWYTYSLQGSFV